MLKDSLDVLSISRMSRNPPAGNRDTLEQATHGELVALVRKLLARVEALEAENATLREQVRESKRATAPFSKGKGKSEPKKPGRKAGEGSAQKPECGGGDAQRPGQSVCAGSEGHAAGGPQAMA